MGLGLEGAAIQNGLENRVELSGTVLKWLNSYLQDRNYFVSIDNNLSEQTKMMCGVPQGSILGPLLFHIEMLPLGHIIQNININYHNMQKLTLLYH